MELEFPPGQSVSDVALVCCWPESRTESVVPGLLRQDRNTWLHILSCAKSAGRSVATPVSSRKEKWTLPPAGCRVELPNRLPDSVTETSVDLMNHMAEFASSRAATRVVRRVQSACPQRFPVPWGTAEIRANAELALLEDGPDGSGSGSDSLLQNRTQVGGLWFTFRGGESYFS